MRRALLTVTGVIALMTPAAVPAQIPGEVIGSAVIDVPNDAFGCGQGDTPCNLRLRVYNDLDSTDFFGAANPVDGYPRFLPVRHRYAGDAQMTGNYPSAQSLYDLTWFAVWDGVIDPDTYAHVGFYGAQSQIIQFAELGNPGSTTCLPVVSQTACFPALSRHVGNDLDAYGPAGQVSRLGGLSPIPRPTVTLVSPGTLRFAWEQVSATTLTDGAPDPIVGYKLMFAVRDRFDRVGPSASELAGLDLASELIDATPGVVMPLTTTSFTLSASDPVLGSFDPSTQSLVAVLRLVYAADVLSTQFSANSYPAAFLQPREMVTDFRASFHRDRVVVDWSMNALAGLSGFNVLRSARASGPYSPVSPTAVPVSGVSSTFYLNDLLDRRMPARTPGGSLFYQLELLGLDGSRTLLGPIEVDVSSYRRGGANR